MKRLFATSAFSEGSLLANERDKEKKNGGSSLFGFFSPVKKSSLGSSPADPGEILGIRGGRSSSCTECARTPRCPRTGAPRRLRATTTCPCGLFFR